MAEIKIPSNDEIISMIPSKACREYLTKLKWEFSERDRELLYRYIVLNEDEPFKEIGEKDDFVSFPHPFRSGDIVTVVNNHNCDVGIFASCRDDGDMWAWEMWANKKMAGLLDFTDTASTRVEFLQPDGSFSHDHPAAYLLEYAELSENDPRKPALQIASELLKGTESSLETLKYYCNRYAETGRDAAEDIIDSRFKKACAEFDWSEENIARLQDLNAFLSQKEHQVYDEVWKEARRIAKDYPKVIKNTADDENKTDSRKCFWVHGEIIFTKHDDYTLKGVDCCMLNRMQDRCKYLYCADWDSRYDGLEPKNDDYDLKDLNSCREINFEDHKLSVCKTFESLWNTFTPQDLVSVDKKVFGIKITVERELF